MDKKSIGSIKLHSSKELENSRVSVGFECLDRELFDPERCYDLLGKTGAKWARCQTGWNRCEKEKGVYTFEWLDSIIDNLLERGVQPWFNVGFGNPIYMEDSSNPTCVGCVPTLYGEEVKEAWVNFIHALTKHFKGRVKYYEIWNEPNCTGFWYPGTPSGKEYAELVSITGEAIRAEDKDAKIGGCMAGLLHSIAKEGDCAMVYVEDFAKTLKPGEIDFFAYHVYLWFPEVASAKHFEYVKQILKDYGHTNIEYWNGESGHASWYPENYGQFKWKTQGNEHRQSVWLLRRFFLDIDFDAQVSSVFQMVDMWQKPYVTSTRNEKKTAAQGILNGITYTPKKSYEIISRLATILSGEISQTYLDAYPWYPDKPVEMAALQMISFTRNSKPVLAFWRPSFVEDEEPTIDGLVIKLSNRNVPNPITDPVLVDMLTGEVFEIESKKFQNNIWVFYGLPMAEYPMLICDRSTYEIDEVK